MRKGTNEVARHLEECLECQWYCQSPESSTNVNGIFILLSTKYDKLHHFDEACLDLIIIFSKVKRWTYANILSAWSREFM